MPWHEPLNLKLRRRLWKPLHKIIHSKRYYVTHYYGADFLLAPRGIGALETSLKILEYPELTHLMARCRALKVDTFIDVGANIGIYSCILLRNGAAPKAMLFEPDRVNQIQLQANLLINDLLDRAEPHTFALGARNAKLHLLPGTIARPDYKMADGGFSQIVEDGSHGDQAYEVDVVRFDDRFALKDRTLAIKIDVEHYECNVLAGMERTLRENRCVVQVESFELKDDVMALMTGYGYAVTQDFMPNWVFEKPVG